MLLYHTKSTGTPDRFTPRPATFTFSHASHAPSGSFSCGLAWRGTKATQVNWLPERLSVRTKIHLLHVEGISLSGLPSRWTSRNALWGGEGGMVGGREGGREEKVRE